MRFFASGRWQPPQAERTSAFSTGMPSSDADAAAGAGVCCANAGEAATHAARMSANLTMTPSFSTEAPSCETLTLEGRNRDPRLPRNIIVPPVNAAAIPAAPSGLFRDVASPNCVYSPLPARMKP